MGSVFERGGKFYLKWRDAGGRRIRRVCAARTKKQALLLLAELELSVDRQRKGLEARPVESGKTLGQVCEWWLETKCSKSSLKRETSRLRLHIVGSLAGDLPLLSVTTEALQERFDALKKAGAAPGSLKKLRSTLISVFFRARKAKLWAGPSPIEGVEVDRVPKRVHKTLRTEEVPGLLAWVPDDWRNFFAAAIWLALRKGEICGLQKTDIDWEFLTVRVARSYDNDTTKGDREDTLPIPSPLAPFLKDACDRSPSEWVFPGTGGKMRTEHCDPQRILRSALVRAGLIEGHIHGCRQCKAKGGEHVERHADNNLRRCPACGGKLWATPVPRKMTFHDLRHTTATLLIRAGVPWPHVQKIIRHANIQTTLDTYGHLDVEDLRAGLEKVAPLSEEQQRQLVAVNDSPEIPGPKGVQMRDSVGGSPSSERKISNEAAMLDSGRTQVRTVDPRLVRASSRVLPGASGTPTVRHGSRVRGGVDSHRSPANAPGGPGSGPIRPHLRAVGSGVVALLSVREVAARLKVSTASIYKLCDSGQLAHSRIGSAIRISEDALADFLAGVSQ